LPLRPTPLATAGDDDSRAGNRLSTFGNFLGHQVGNQAGARGLPDLVAQVLRPAGGHVAHLGDVGPVARNHLLVDLGNGKDNIGCAM